jgi:hypothetical protein
MIHRFQKCRYKFGQFGQWYEGIAKLPEGHEFSQEQRAEFVIGLDGTIVRQPYEVYLVGPSFRDMHVAIELHERK